MLYEMGFFLVLYSYGRAMDCMFFEKFCVAEHLARFTIERVKTESHKLLHLLGSFWDHWSQPMQPFMIAVLAFKVLQTQI